jgi:hypothetical protein
MTRRRVWWVVSAAVLMVLGGVAWAVADGRRTEREGIRVAHSGAGLGAATSPSRIDPAATCVNAPADWLAAESRRRGVDVLPPPAQQESLGAVASYLDRTSAQCGEEIGLHLSSRVRVRARVTAVRVGSYPGGSARVVWESGVLSVAPQAPPRAVAARSTVVAHWPITLTIRPTAAWPPGLYLLRIAAVNAPTQPSFVPLRIRTNGERAPRLVISSDLTQLAYNSYGGSSLYGGAGHTHDEMAADRAYLAAADRPLAGSGLGQVFSMEVPLARLLDAHGLVADWTTDSSFDLNPAQADGYASIVLPGHSEYWTRAAYDALQREVDRGVNLAVLGANEIYWQARLHREAGGRLVGMTVFRDRTIDPVADRSLVTTQWREWPLSRDPAALTGAGMAGVGAFGDLTVVSTPAWVFRGMPEAIGTGLVGAIGNEADGVEPAGGHSPPNVQVILRGEVLTTDHPGKVLVTTSYYSAPGGAGVFAAGTTYWLCGALGTCPDRAVPPATGLTLTGMTVNVLAAFATHGWGGQAPSVQP